MQKILNLYLDEDLVYARRGRALGTAASRKARRAGLLPGLSVLTMPVQRLECGIDNLLAQSPGREPGRWVEPPGLRSRVDGLTRDRERRVQTARRSSEGGGERLYEGWNPAVGRWAGDAEQAGREQADNESHQAHLHQRKRLCGASTRGELTWRIGPVHSVLD